MCAIAVATAPALFEQVRASDQPIDLDQNAANGQESRVSTRVLQTYPVMIENTVYNNSPGVSYSVDWGGAGPGGFLSNVTAGPGVGVKWVWSTVYQVYSINSPALFTPTRSLTVFGSDPQGGVTTIGPSSGGSFVLPGKSIYPTQVTLSNASLSSSLITFFSPEKTVATCGSECTGGQCDVVIKNLAGGAVNVTATQLDCCPEAHQTLCDGECTSYLTDPANCGGCGNVCAADQVCSDGACVCQPGLTECASECVDALTDPANCGACGNACSADETCSGGACVCDPGLTRCAEGCLSLKTDPANCGACGHACYTDEFCSDGACVCNPGLARCGDACVDLQDDPANCGGCGLACAAGQSCSNGACVCPPGQAMCGGACRNLQDDPLNCGACGNVCGANSVCSAGACRTCRPPLGTACDNRCVNLHTDPLNCGACGLACDFSSCPSTGQGTCSQGQSCVCAPAPTLTGSELTRTAKERLRFKPVRRPSRATVTPTDPSPISVEAPERTLRQSAIRVPVSGLVAPSAGAVATTTASRPRLTSVVEAPVCDLPSIAQVIPPGGTYRQTQADARFGREIQTSVSIAVNGNTIAQGPCSLVVPVTDVDTAGVILSPASVAVQDTSGDGLCQPGEARCDLFISVSDLGDSACLNPVATLTSPPDERDPGSITFLTATSPYPSLPAWPGAGVTVQKLTNTTAFAITTPGSQLPDVGRPFSLSVACSNLQEPVVMPLNLGIGSACNPAVLDGRTYDLLTGLQAPVKARLVPPGTPVNFSTGKFNLGSTIPLKLSLGCGGVILTGDHINPRPQVVSLEHTVLGPQSLLGINGDNNANPDNPLFSCSSTSCDFQFRTEQLPAGTYVIGIQMPDTRVFRAGFTISP